MVSASVKAAMRDHATLLIKCFDVARMTRLPSLRDGRFSAFSSLAVGSPDPCSTTLMRNMVVLFGDCDCEQVRQAVPGNILRKFESGALALIGLAARSRGASTVADSTASFCYRTLLPAAKSPERPFGFFSWKQDCDTVESGDKSQLSSEFRSYTVLPRCWMRELQMQTTDQTEDGVAGTDVASEAPEYPRVEQDAGSGLANIFINCPITGVPVTTGLTTNWVVFHSLPAVAIPLRCRACGQMHRWKPRDAWIGRAAQSSDMTLIGASSALAG